MACGTVTHSPAETSTCASLIGNRCFDLCRSGRMNLPGFPDMKKTVSELKTVVPPPQPEYAVTFPMGECLVIKEALIEQWSSKSEYAAEMEAVLKKHNDSYNKRGLKRQSENSASSTERPNKKLCIETDAMDLDEFETKYTERQG